MKSDDNVTLEDKNPKKDFDLDSRWGNYIKAGTDFPVARKIEIDEMLERASAQEGEKVADFGCGDGAITLPLAEAVGPDGHVTALDASDGMLRGLTRRIGDLAVDAVHLTGPDLPLADGSVDLVTSLANFHHVPDKIRQAREFARILRPGGRLVIGDVPDNTNIQRYFDGAVDEMSSTGHKHRFLDPWDAEFMCAESGLTLVSWEIRPVPWIFVSPSDAARFLHLIHDATCTPQECLDRARLDLGYHEEPGRFLLFWKLFYLIAHKPIS